MGPNDAELVRVYTRNPGGAIADVTFPFNQNIEIVVEAEAGSAIFGSGAGFEVGVVVRDLTDNTIIPTTGAIADSLSAGAWSTQSTQFTFTISSADLGAAKENHIVEVIAFLRVRVADPDVSFARSPLFMITRP
ncbi:MAG: hypothetical protein D6814_15220 [Calditrichaeota bacterium]|nr:MAG: hypothetical protein D6814_15220 [Calditrichota bacterium]